MQTIKLEKGTVTLYESIKNERGFTIGRFNEFQNYLLQDIGIGNDMAAIDNHFAKLDEFIKNENYADAMRERQNLHYNFFSAFNKINYKSLCFACLVHSIDGEVIEDFSESHLLQIIGRLDRMGLTQGLVEAMLDDVKKKLIQR